MRERRDGMRERRDGMRERRDDMKERRDGMRKITVFVLMALMIGCLTGCGNMSEENQYTENLMTQAYDTVGFPDVSNYFERSQLKEIYELRDNPNLICHWYTKNDMTGKWIYQGTCVGYGIPYTTSMTAPEDLQRTETFSGASYDVMPLAEPNGLYASPSTSATWILATGDKGGIKPVYVESEITVSQNKLPARLCEDWSLPEGYERTK